MVDSAPLNDGRRLPMVGFGVYQLRPGRTTREAVLTALEAGYRHIDTATIYRNEADVGAAIREFGIPRSDVWVTTKLSNADHGAPLDALRTSLDRLGMDYVDLWLMHWPAPPRLRSWQFMTRARADGLAKSIGVSNFLTRHLAELHQASDITPAVNQIELSPFLLGTRADTVRQCADHGITIEAYSPLTKGARLNHPSLRAIAATHHVTPAQVLLRWCLQHNFVTLPRSSNPDRIRANLDLDGFQLSTSDISTLDALDEGLTTGWDPATAR
jgi:diketogulonate reductase-like aldo/keto reductase